MTVGAQLLLTVLVTGLVVGVIAGVGTQGKGFMACMAAGVVGAFAFIFILARMGHDRALALVGGDLFVLAIATSLLGAIIFVALVRVLFEK